MTVATPTPDPKPEKVAKGWTCSDVLGEPTPSPDPTATPVAGQTCAVTDWYTPDPAPTVTATVTAAPTSTPTATVTAEPSPSGPVEVVLAPGQFDLDGGPAAAPVFLLGVLVLIGVACFVYFLSRPGAFGIGSWLGRRR